MLFLVALWWQEQKAKPSVERRLRRLLRDRYHDADINFVIELIQRNLIPGSKIPNLTVNFLLRKFTEGQQDQDEGRWVVTVERLYLLDPKKAIAELERVVRDLGRTITPGRKRAAVEILMKDDPACGAKNLGILADSSLDKTGEPQDWLDTAIWIDKYSCELSERTILRLTGKPEMGDLRADAAISVNSFERMCELIRREGTLSDQARLRLSRKLCDQNLKEPYGQKWPMAVTAMQQFAQIAREDGTPLWIAKMVKPHDQPVALRIADDVAWNKKIDSGERLNAVIWIGEIEPAQTVLGLEQLSEDSSVTDKVRLAAAMRIVTHHDGPITAVVKLGYNLKLDHNYRIEAAEFVGQRDHVTGARLYISIAKTCKLPYPQLNLLRKAYKLDPGPAADALAEFAENPRIPGKIRLDAIEIARQKLDKQRTIGLYTTIAKTTDNDSALTSAREVMKINLDAGRRLMGELADQNKDIISFRLPAALEADTYGTRVLKAFMSTAQPYTVRFTVARALWDIGRKPEAEPTLRELVKTSGAGKVRIDAARTLPDAVNALITITNDRREKEENIRFDAGLEAEKKNPKEGRRALRELAGDPEISEALREKIRRHLNE